MACYDELPIFNYALSREDLVELIQANPTFTPMTSQFSSRSWGSSGSHQTSISSPGHSPTQFQTHAYVPSHHESPVYATSPLNYDAAQYHEDYVTRSTSRHGSSTNHHHLQSGYNLPSLYDPAENATPDTTAKAERRSRQGSDSRHGNAGQGSGTGGAKEGQRCYCPREECRDEDGRPNRPFSRPADVKRHICSFHTEPTIDCPRFRCVRTGMKGFTRHDHLVEHLRGYHGENIPKRESSTAAHRQDRSNRHELSVHEAPSFDCPRIRCERTGTKGFTRQDRLVEHLRSDHAELIPKRESSTSVYRQDRSHRHER